MAVSLALAMCLSKKQAIKYGSSSITSIHMSEDKSALVFTFSDGTEMSVPIEFDANKESSSVYTGSGVPDVKANENDIYIDKLNKKIYCYSNYKWEFLCDIGITNELLNDISNMKNDIDKIKNKVSKLNVSLRLI